jgi:CubicO group peptidase (beta-lactamase class C family)
MLVAAVTTAAGSQEVHAADPRQAQIDAVFAAWNKPTSPGCNVFVFQDGKIAFQQQYGMADLEEDLPLKSDSVFYLASMSKQFTAAAIALLVSENKIDLKASPRTYIPELPALYDRVTISQMLHHTSGLRDYLALGFLTGHEVQSNDQALALLSKQQDLNFEPGSSWSYSNSNFLLLSIVVERVSGQNFSAFMHDNFFQPLAMDHSVVDQDHRSIVKGRVQGYIPDASGGWLHLPKMLDATGDGNVLTTVADLQRWDENFYSGNVGGAGFAARMMSDSVAMQPMNMQYAWGLMLQSYRGQPVVHHSGAFNGFRSELVRFPKLHVSTGLLCNAGNVDANLAFKVADIWLSGALTAPSNATPMPPPSPPAPTFNAAPTQLSAFAGRFRSPELNIEIEIVPRDGGLQIEGLFGQTSKLKPLAAGKLQFHSKLAEFGDVTSDIRGISTPDGKINELRLSAARTNNIRFDRITD